MDEHGNLSEASQDERRHERCRAQLSVATLNTSSVKPEAVLAEGVYDLNHSTTWVIGGSGLVEAVVKPVQCRTAVIPALRGRAARTCGARSRDRLH